jgi:hypothetical protein
MMKAKIYAKPDAKHLAQSKSLVSGHVCCEYSMHPLHSTRTCGTRSHVFQRNLIFRIVKAQN